MMEIIQGQREQLAGHLYSLQGTICMNKNISLLNYLKRLLYTIITNYHSISILATCYVGYPRTPFNLIQNLIRQFPIMHTCKFKILIRIHHLFLFIIPTKHTPDIVRKEEPRGNQQVLVMH